MCEQDRTLGRRAAALAVGGLMTKAALENLGLPLLLLMLKGQL